MGVKSTVRSVESNREDIQVLAQITAMYLFDHISASLGKERTIARALTMDIFMTELLHSMEFHAGNME